MKTITQYNIIMVRPDGADGRTEYRGIDEESMRHHVSTFHNRAPETFKGWSMRVEKFEKVEVMFFE